VNAIRGNRLRGKRKAPNPVMLTAFALPWKILNLWRFQNPRFETTRLNENIVK
jgi:hypothetical protein